MRASRNKALKLVSALAYAATSPKTLRTHLGQIYGERCSRAGRIPVVDARTIAGGRDQIVLTDCLPEDGNVSALELLCLCTLVRMAQPRVILEIGTFNGNTTLQLAANAPDEATLYTLDLPPGAQGCAANDRFDGQCIGAEGRATPRYRGTCYEPMIKQVHGDSLATDFSVFCQQGSPQFVFIDAGHSYACVKNDSEKSLAILDRGGIVVWHDYTQLWPDVYNYLNDLALERELFSIRDTSLVVHLDRV